MVFLYFSWRVVDVAEGGADLDGDGGDLGGFWVGFTAALHDSIAGGAGEVRGCNWGAG